MAIRPEVAFAGTVAEMLVEVAEATEAWVPLNVTLSLTRTSKPVPEILTAPPTLAIAGANEAIDKPVVGAVTVNEMLLVAVPLGVVTAIGPEAAPVGTVTIN